MGNYLDILLIKQLSFENGKSLPVSYNQDTFMQKMVR
jgi:hypothetical protein